MRLQWFSPLFEFKWSGAGNSGKQSLQLPDKVQRQAKHFVSIPAKLFLIQILVQIEHFLNPIMLGQKPLRIPA